MARRSTIGAGWVEVTVATISAGTLATSQATSGRPGLRVAPPCVGRLVALTPNLPDARASVRTISTAVARRPTASTMTSGGST